MTAALQNLREAQRNLEVASRDKGGHRVKPWSISGRPRQKSRRHSIRQNALMICATSVFSSLSPESAATRTAVWVPHP